MNNDIDERIEAAKRKIEIMKELDMKNFVKKWEAELRRLEYEKDKTT